MLPREPGLQPAVSGLVCDSCEIRCPDEASEVVLKRFPGPCEAELGPEVSHFDIVSLFLDDGV